MSEASLNAHVLVFTCTAAHGSWLDLLGVLASALRSERPCRRSQGAAWGSELTPHRITHVGVHVPLLDVEFWEFEPVTTWW